MDSIDKIFNDLEVINQIQKKLPKLFQLAEVDNSRDGKIGMEIGSTRERIIIALLIYHFGEENVTTDIPITKSETDVIVFNEPVSIKTLTNKKVIGFKLIWTVDSQKALEFINAYNPECDMLLIHINWSMQGGAYLIKKESQIEILNRYGKEFYFKLPKEGTNTRGVEITKEAINELIEHSKTQVIKINWVRGKNENFTPYDRWIDLWKIEE